MRGILQRVGTTTPDTVLVPSTGLKSADTNLVHFDRASLIKFGRRYAENLERLQNSQAARVHARAGNIE